MGHNATVMSLDFHPNKDDLICSCDSDGEIRYWSISHGSYAGVFKVKLVDRDWLLSLLGLNRMIENRTQYVDQNVIFDIFLCTTVSFIFKTDF